MERRLTNYVLVTAAVLVVVPMASAQPKPSRKAQMDALFAEFAGKAPGASVVVARDGRVVFKAAYGIASFEEGRGATTKTNYRLASVSKQFTAAVILMLAERRMLSLDDPLTKFFPGFPQYGATIRIRHLLNHTSGLLAYEDFIPKGATKPVLDRDVLKLMMAQGHTHFPPGTKFRYSNSGYAVLACIAEEVSGRAFPELLEAKIFRPLKMKYTTMNLRGARMRWRALGYSKREGSYEATDQSLTSYVLGDGGIYSSVEDLLKWEQALLRGTLLRPWTLSQAMRASTAAEEPDTGYGFGWYVGRHAGRYAVWHDGTTIGFRNFYLRFPDEKLAVIVLTNRNEAKAGDLARKVADLFLTGPR